jgi:polynucleotide 5'-hydroxyl-kinase GRC3/NOL9
MRLLTVLKRLVILGEFNLSVRKGQVTLLGATLGPSDTSHRVFAPSTHSLPVLRCLATEVDDAEIILHQCSSGIDLLKPLSSLFGKLWNDDTGAFGPEFESQLKRNKTSTFQIVLFP